MKMENLKLSENGEKIYREAVKKAKEDLKKYRGRIRTTFFFPEGAGKGVKFIELRDYIEEIVREYGMEFPFSDKETDYFVFVNMKFFDVLSMRLHRMYPENYMVVTQKEDGDIVGIIRDHGSRPSSNLKIVWKDGKFDEGKQEKVEFHLTRKQLQ